HYSVAFVVTACRCFGKGRSKSTDGESQNGHTKDEFHEHLEAGQGTPTVTYPSKKTKRKTRAGPAGKPGQVQSETTESKDAPLSDRLSILSLDRKSTRLNSSHGSISYAVFCLKKKKFNP